MSAPLTRVVRQSDLSNDPDIADWLFESAGVDTQSDPLQILLQRELEEEQEALESGASYYQQQH
jgi:hypothetical protein